MRIARLDYRRGPQIKFPGDKRPEQTAWFAALLTAVTAVFLSPALSADDSELRFEGRYVVETPQHSSERRSIDAALQRAYARIAKDSVQALKPQALDHTTVLTWPVREAVSFTDPSVWAISNYLDQNPESPDLEDWNCGAANARTYDGHRGLDIFTSPFSWYQMEKDSGIVIAAAPGIIRDKVGDQPERSCSIDGAGGDNNVVVIEHEDGSLGVYAHMRTDSLTKKPLGARVEAGDYLGVIGSSGNSTGPHLHFEVGFWEGSNWVPQDPYKGQCNNINQDTWWKQQPGYYSPAILAVTTHSQQPSRPACPQTETPYYQDIFTSGNTVFLAASLRDLRLGDTLDVTVDRPNGSRFLSSSYTEQQWDHLASAMFVFSMQLPMGADAGLWEYSVTFEGKTESTRFRVNQSPPGPVAIGAGNNAYNGLWYDPALDGEGFNIVTTSAGTIIYFYGSDSNGKRLWLVSELITAPFSNGQDRTIVMFESTGGTFAEPIPSGRGLSIWGELELRFNSCTGGVAAMNGEDGQKTSQLTKIVAVPGSNCTNDALQADSPYAGLWYNPALEGEGFNLVVTAFGSVIYYYGFDDNGDRLWLVTAPFEFDYASGNSINVELLRAGSGTFTAPVPPPLTSWGNMTIEGDTCNQMRFSLDTNEGTKNMQSRRLVSVVGLDC